MAQKTKEKAKRAPSRARAKTPTNKTPTKSKASAAASKASDGVGASSGRLETRIKVLEQERDRLKSDLEAAHLRIAALEENRSTVANRIDWVIERLGGVVERGD